MYNGQKPLDSFSVTIPAGTVAVPGSVKIQQSGVSFYVRSASGDFQMQFDAGTIFSSGQGYAFEQGTDLPPGVRKRFDTVTLFNSSSVAITVTGFVGQTGVRYIGTDNFKAAATFIRGNLGGGTTAWTVTKAVSGSYLGHRRKTLFVTVFNVLNTTPVYADILDSSGNLITRVYGNTTFTGGTSIVALETDADVTVAPGSGASFVVSEIFYAN